MTSVPRAVSYSLIPPASCRIPSLDSQPGSKLPAPASLRAHKLSHQLVWRAEQGKIALSDHHEHNYQTLNELEKGWRRHSPAPAGCSASAPLLERRLAS